MDEETWASVLAAYRQGVAADFLWVATHEDGERQWGVLWTIPPCSPGAAKQATQQFARMRARRLRHARCAVLRRKPGENGLGDDRRMVVIVTVLPGPVQEIRCLISGRRLQFGVVFRDAVLQMLETALPTN